MSDIIREVVKLCIPLFTGLYLGSLYTGSIALDSVVGINKPVWYDTIANFHTLMLGMIAFTALAWIGLTELEWRLQE